MSTRTTSTQCESAAASLAALPKNNVITVTTFIDFWNFQVAMDHWRTRFRMDWSRVGPWLAEKTGALLRASGHSGQVQHGGVRVFASHNPLSPKDDGLRRWVRNVVGRFPDVEVILKERRSKHAPDCPSCFQRIATCPACGGSMHRSMEKGMDTAIVTDMIHLAWEGQWDVAVLVSADGDFIPAVQFLHRTGRRVVHAGFAGQGTALARACWGSLDIAGTLHELDRTKNEPLDASRGHVTARARRRIASENRAFAPVGRVSLEEIRRKVSPEVRKTDPCPD